MDRLQNVDYSPIMTSVFLFKDFRLFLKKHYEGEKLSSPSFSYTQFAKNCGIASSSFMQMIIAGKRNLTITNIHLFAKALGLGGEELNFFETLVLENQASHSVERIFYAKRLLRMRKAFLSEKKPLTKRVKRNPLIESATRSAIAILADGRPTLTAPDSISKSLGLSLAVCNCELKSLVHTRALSEIDGRYRLLEKHLMISDPKGFSQSQLEFLKNGLQESVEVFSSRYSKGSAKFLSLLFTAPAGSLQDLFSTLRLSVEASTQAVSELESSDTGVYRVQLQCYRYLNSGE